ncbi:MAG: DUF4350 domain-containing protein [Candidatus Obscuribacterales bacterium]|jgi:hypothetical protein|nr:DUF4350 domain-containing protein [Candidatus Obscuribacterales bacterium]
MWAKLQEAPKWTRNLLWQIPLLAAVLLLGGKVQELFDNSLDKMMPEAVSFTSTHNQKPSGYSALLELTQRVGMKSTQWMAPYRDLQKEHGTLVIVSPSHPLKEFEIDQLVTWVQKGNKLVYLDQFKYGNGEHLLGKLGVNVTQLRDADDTDIVVDKLPSFDEMAHVKRLVLSSDARLKGGKPIADDKRGAFLVQLTEGKGRVLVGTTPNFCSNRRISDTGQWGNFQFMLNWLRANGDNVLFDERVHGYSTSQSLLSVVAKTPLGMFCAQLSLIFLIALFSLNQRFGRLHVVHQARKIASSEFIDGMARTYLKARAYEAAFQILYISFRHRLCKAVSLPPDEPAESLARAWSSSAPVSNEEALNFLKNADGLAGRQKIEMEELVETMVECDRLYQTSKSSIALQTRRIGG